MTIWGEAPHCYRTNTTVTEKFNIPRFKTWKELFQILEEAVKGDVGKLVRIELDKYTVTVTFAKEKHRAWEHDKKWKIVEEAENVKMSS